MILVASKNIAKGEEISDNYGALYSEVDTKTRRQWMKVACKPEMVDRKIDVLLFRNTSCSFAPVMLVWSSGLLCLGWGGRRGDKKVSDGQISESIIKH